MLRRTAGATLVSLLAAPSAFASPGPQPAYSAYEARAIADAERALATTPDPSPEGKTIERVDFVRLDPIDVHDPAPLVLDAAHATSRPFVLRRELLVVEGGPWRQALVDESARNLRGLSQLSLVLCVAMRGSTPDRVRLVVITKDVWSLYVDFDLEGSFSSFNSLTLEPKESNLAGLHHALTGRLVLEPAAITLGARYEVPRLDGRFLSLAVEGDVVVNRQTGHAEGTYGTASIARPLFSSRAGWAWSAGVDWNDTLVRTYRDGRVISFPDPPVPGVAPIPWVYRRRTLTETLGITRSLGLALKNDLTAGFSVAHARYTVPDAAGLDPATVRAFATQQVPLGEDRVGPFVQWHGYPNDYARVLDVDTLSLQEDVHVGYEGWLRLYPVLAALGSSRTLVGTYAAVGYTIALGDGFARGTVESTIETDLERVSDASVTGTLTVVTPRTGAGRLVLGAQVVDRIRDSLRLQSVLGGDNRLRGYPENAFRGQDLVVGNLEYRGPAFALATIQVSGVAFYDVGDAFTGFDQLRPHHSVGFGLRAVFPQIERPVFRLDVGFPVGPQAPGPAAVYAFHQAVPIPAIGVGFGP
jgi:hypothetical protein